VPRASLVGVSGAPGASSLPKQTGAPSPFAAPTRAPITALAIGCSTGGPNALGSLFEQLPGDLPVPIFIVQHMPPLFTRILAERLTASSPVRVVEASHGAPVEPGEAYIAPGDHHMVLGRQGARLVTLLNQDEPENSCRPAVDPLFRSLARCYGPGVLACVLTGMGGDGARGAREIVNAGGLILAQSPETCVVSSMPRAVIAAGLADAVLPLERIAEELVLRVRSSQSSGARASLLLQREA
jgi:two-component system chemotaxis response regulator CheB